MKTIRQDEKLIICGAKYYAYSIYMLYNEFGLKERDPEAYQKEIEKALDKCQENPFLYREAWITPEATMLTSTPQPKEQFERIELQPREVFKFEGIEGEFFIDPPSIRHNQYTAERVD